MACSSSHVYFPSDLRVLEQVNVFIPTSNECPAEILACANPILTIYHGVWGFYRGCGVLEGSAL